MHNKLIKFVRKVYQTQKFIPLHAPVFDKEDEKALIRALNDGYVSTVGPAVEDFENKIKELTGAKYAIATVNGTAALHIALKLSGVKPNTEVITQSFTFVATCNAIKYCGADPVFIDIDPENLGMSQKSLREFLESSCEIRDDGKCWNKMTNQEVIACLPMHTYGFPSKIENIKKICESFKIKLIEDSAESLGSYYNGKHTGTFGNSAIFSFNGNKVITTGGGGMIITNKKSFALAAKHLTTTAKNSHPWLFDHDQVGYNYRMPSINAALGLSQIKRLKRKLDDKRNLAESYQHWGHKHGYDFIIEPIKSHSNYWLNLLVAKDIAERDKILEETNKNGVMTRPAWTPMHKLKMFKNCHKTEMLTTEWFYDRIVNMPSSPKI